MKLLLIDTDLQASGWLARQLASHGFVPRVLPSLEQALREKGFDQARAIMADAGTAGSDGVSATRLIRQASVELPLMILSSRNDWRDTIASLDAGADDYLIKPVRSEEVAARLRAIIRRGQSNASGNIVMDDLELDLKAKCAWLSGKCLDLTRNEFRLLSLFLLEPNRVLTHREIRLKLHADNARISHNAIEVQIARLRRKVGKRRILTMRGLGYRYSPGPADSCAPATEREPCGAAACVSSPNEPDSTARQISRDQREKPRLHASSAIARTPAHHPLR